MGGGWLWRTGGTRRPGAEQAARGGDEGERPLKVLALELLPRALAGCGQGLRAPACIVTLSWQLKQALEAKAEQGEAIKGQLKTNSLWFSTVAAR